ncbi:MAG TPA: prepilin-type N-terminal cleavage/methylation domain-containing protein [Desulfuromonadales bacterium]|nr:prepilin-type N-terminal cleavage/methylation domain-containing protein [Desulfuromonadales bacterium]
MSAICRNRGFTLLEVLIAVVLLGILSAALYGSYFGVARARERASAGMESQRELGATLDLIRREIASSLFSRTDKRLRFTVEDRDNFGAPASTLELTTLTPVPAGTEQSRRESGLATVSYRLTDKNGKRMMTRREYDPVFDATGVLAYPQMERISSFLVECYDGSKWVKSWDTSINGRLPAMVRITVTVEEEGRLREFSVLSAPRLSGVT